MEERGAEKSNPEGASTGRKSGSLWPENFLSMGNQPSFITQSMICACCYEGEGPSDSVLTSWRKETLPSGDDESYKESHQYHMRQDDGGVLANRQPPANTLAASNCRHHDRQPRQRSGASLSFTQSQMSEMDGSRTSRGIEARSDPSVVMRTNSTSEREDVEDAVLGSRGNSREGGGSGDD